jgi:YVTN family beta-propeller protein
MCLCAALPTAAQNPITADNWGSVTAPVFGKSEAGVYSGADLFAGPRKFGDNYFWGVLPNGRVVKPEGISIQIGMDPLGAALTPDGKYLITSNDDERGGMGSIQHPEIPGGCSISVIDTATMKMVATTATGPLFGGLEVTGAGPYTIWASGGGANVVRCFELSTSGQLVPAALPTIPISPILPKNQGYVSNYTPADTFRNPDEHGVRQKVPSSFNREHGAQITFPAGMALSPDNRYLYVACNGDNSVAVIDTAAKTVVARKPVGYFPYSISVSQDGSKVLVSNWGIEEYRFHSPKYSPVTKDLLSIEPTGDNTPDGFYVPRADTRGMAPKSSSISVLGAAAGNARRLTLLKGVYEGHQLDALRNVGDTHPSATAIVRRGGLEVLYVTKSNSDSIGLIRLDNFRKLPDLDLAPLSVRLADGHRVHGAYPQAIVAATDGSRAYVAEGGVNSVAVLDTGNPAHPALIGRIATGWYPSALALSRDGRVLYVVNMKGIGEDINPKTDLASPSHPTGVESFDDSNYVFGTVQRIDLASVQPDSARVLANSFAVQPAKAIDARVVPIGGPRSRKIEHVIMILHENKTFDSMLGNLSQHFGPYASLTYTRPDGSPITEPQFTGVSINFQRLAAAFSTAVNYYSDSEESDAGHQFCSSGTASDYTERTILVKDGRGMLVNKNMEPEDYPESGYIFNNAARHDVSFKDYGDLIRITGTDTGTSVPTRTDDPSSGEVGYPQLGSTLRGVKLPLVNRGDVSSSTQGLGQSYFLDLPDLAVLGMNNANGEPHVDGNYPGYNFNISDQRRALEFIRDYDRMLAAGTLPQLMHVYLPNDHMGSVQAPNRSMVGSSPFQQVADGDVALGMIVQHVMKSRAYYNSETGQGTAIFITFDDAQATRDHIHQHRTGMVLVSPFAKRGYLGKRHYVSASIVKTEELLLGLPPNNLGDLLATDMRDMFQPDYNGVKASDLTFTREVSYRPTPEGLRIWKLAALLDTAAPDRDSKRLGAVARLSIRADALHRSAARAHRLHRRSYARAQRALLAAAERIARTPTGRDDD